MVHPDCSVDENDGVSREPPVAAPRLRSSKLMRSLQNCTEITASTPTRYQKATDTGVILDRVFTTLPPSDLKLCKVPTNVEQDPKQLYTSGISDHAPIGICIAFQPVSLMMRGLSRLNLLNTFCLDTIWRAIFGKNNLEAYSLRLLLIN